MIKPGYLSASEAAQLNHLIQQVQTLLSGSTNQLGNLSTLNLGGVNRQVDLTPPTYTAKVSAGPDGSGYYTAAEVRWSDTGTASSLEGGRTWSPTTQLLKSAGGALTVNGIVTVRQVGFTTAGLSLYVAYPSDSAGDVLASDYFGFWAELTSLTGNNYAWREMEWSSSSNLFSVKSGGRTGTVSSHAARNPYTTSDIPTGTVVWIKKVTDGEDYLIDWLPNASQYTPGLVSVGSQEWTGPKTIYDGLSTYGAFSQNGGTAESYSGYFNALNGSNYSSGVDVYTMRLNDGPGMNLFKATGGVAPLSGSGYLRMEVPGLDVTSQGLVVGGGIQVRETYNDDQVYASIGVLGSGGDNVRGRLIFANANLDDGSAWAELNWSDTTEVGLLEFSPGLWKVRMSIDGDTYDGVTDDDVAGLEFTGGWLTGGSFSGVTSISGTSGITATGTTTVTLSIGAGAITTTMIADANVTAAKIADGAALKNGDTFRARQW